MVELYC